MDDFSYFHCTVFYLFIPLFQKLVRAVCCEFSTDKHHFLQNITWLEPQLPTEETTHPPSLSTSVNVAPEVAVK